MPGSGVPNRRRAALLGMIGGAVGVMAMRWYQDNLEPELFPDVSQSPRGLPADDPIESNAMAALYEGGDTALETVGRQVVRLQEGRTPASPDSETQRALDVLLGLSTGLAYGGTRTTTRSRDIAGGFFMGLRMGFAEVVLAPLLGLRAGPSRFRPLQLLGVQMRYWVFSFVMTAVTRALYKVLSPRQW
ncbi:MAG: hypothetical protein IPK19_01900 [Chloroflexi bacterium]|nr:hypothetical protein [Chloroflexota bacterium]